MAIEKIGLGGGCHWCTEAVFASLKGVVQVEQGWIADQQTNFFSEAVIVHYDSLHISLNTLIAVHLCTHSSTSHHSMRNKYRSAVYIFTAAQQIQCLQVLAELQVAFEKPLVTEVKWFHAFHPSQEQERDYYYKNPSKPFCKTHIHPKLKMLLERFPEKVNVSKITAAGVTIQHK